MCSHIILDINKWVYIKYNMILDGLKNSEFRIFTRSDHWSFFSMYIYLKTFSIFWLDSVHNKYFFPHFVSVSSVSCVKTAESGVGAELLKWFITQISIWNFIPFAIFETCIRYCESFAESLCNKCSKIFDCTSFLSC